MIRLAKQKLIFILLLGLSFASFVGAEDSLKELSSVSNIHDLEKEFLGKRIQKISFFHSTNLSYDELARGLGLEPKKHIELGDLSQAVSVLENRDVFESVELKIEPMNDSVRLVFVLQPRSIISSVRFEGDRSISKKNLDGIAAIVKGHHLDLAPIDRFKEALTQNLQEEGYFQAQVAIELKSQEGSPYITLKADIDRGPRAVVKEVVLTDDLPNDLLGPLTEVTERILEKNAVKSSIEILRQELIVACRSEGYLQASIPAPSLFVSNDNKRARVHISIQHGEPTTLNFRGNERFSAEELLAPLNIQKRKVPFGPSAVRNLAREIERLYQSEGFFDAKVSYSRLPARGTRRLYEVLIEEGKRLKPSLPDFRGNSFASDSYLLTLFESLGDRGILARLFARKKIVVDYLERDLEKVVEYYNSQGFFDMTADLELETKSDELLVIVNIEEGERAFIDSVEIIVENLTDTQLPAFDLLSLESEIESGLAYDSQSIEKERNRILRRVRAEGYPRASVKSRLSDDQKKLYFAVNPGDFTRIGEIVVQGNLHTNDEVIFRSLRFTAGEPWSVEKIKQSEKSLYKLGHFRNVVIEPLDSNFDSEVEDIKIVVREVETGSVMAGVGYHSEDGFRLLSEVRQGNILGSGNTATLGFDAYFNEGPRVVDAGNARALYRVPNLLGSPLELFLEGFFRFNIQLIDQFSYDRTGGQMSFIYPASENLRIVSGVEAYYEDVFDVAEEVVVGDFDEGGSLYGFFNTRLEYDLRDDQFNPTAGGRTVLSAAIANQALGSESSFSRLSLRQSWFKKLHPSIVFATSLRGEIIIPFSDTETVPLAQRIFLGGRNSLRGYNLATIGPRRANSFAVGGDKSVVFNSELQFNLSEQVAAVLFVDAGQTYLENTGEFEDSEFDSSQFRLSPGIGLRYKTPIGPISFDYGFAIDRLPGEDFGQFNVGIGLVF